MTDFFDLHTHLLPCMDDGAKSPEESLAILRDSYEQGVRLIAATPHCTVHRPGDIARFLERRSASLRKIESLLDRFDTPKLLLGAEVYADHDLSRDDGIERLCFTGTSTLLLEPPFDMHYVQFAETVYSLNQRGITVLIAHIDRYPKKEEILRELRGLRVIYQVNASRFLGFSGRHLLKKLFAADECFLVSSDTHNMDRRRSCMKAAYMAARKMNATHADEWFAGNAKALLADTAAVTDALNR